MGSSHQDEEGTNDGIAKRRKRNEVKWTARLVAMTYFFDTTFAARL